MVDLGRQSLVELRQPLLSSADSSDDPYGKNDLFKSDCLVCTKVKVNLLDPLYKATMKQCLYLTFNTSAINIMHGYCCVFRPGINYFDIKSVFTDKPKCVTMRRVDRSVSQTTWRTFYLFTSLLFSGFTDSANCPSIAFSCSIIKTAKLS